MPLHVGVSRRLVSLKQFHLKNTPGWEHSTQGCAKGTIIDGETNNGLIYEGRNEKEHDDVMDTADIVLPQGSATPPQIFQRVLKIKI